jgi:hypothetical protein
MISNPFEDNGPVYVPAPALLNIEVLGSEWGPFYARVYTNLSELQDILTVKYRRVLTKLEELTESLNTLDEEIQKTQKHLNDLRDTRYDIFKELLREQARRAGPNPKPKP